MAFNAEEVNDLIRNRRSVYPVQFSGETIHDEVIDHILENANWAPTHKYTEPWRFKVFTGEGLKNLVAKMEEIYRQITPAEKFKEEKITKIRNLASQCSHVLAVIMHRDEKERIPEMEEIAATACAVQNIYLSVYAYGLAGYWSTGNGTYTQEMKNYLALEEKDRCMGFFYMGKYNGPHPQVRRSPVKDKVAWFK